MLLSKRLMFPLAVVIAGCLIAFIQSPSASDIWQSRAARAPIPDLPATPCNKQGWENADRVCLTWTAPHEAANPPARQASDGAAIGAPSKIRTLSNVARLP
jgi:hypothetical protein